MRNLLFTYRLCFQNFLFLVCENWLEVRYLLNVVTTSAGESSEPSSPSRPATPMPPLPTQHCPYECLRADSEDSGLGPSPAKSLVNPTSPASPLQFCGDSDSLLDLSPRTDNSYESDKGPEDPFYNLDKTPAKNSSAFKFLLSSSGSPHHQTTQFSSLRGGESSTESSPSPFCEEDHPFQTARGSSQEDYLRQATPSPLLADGESSTSPSSFFDEQACRDDHPFQTSLPSSPHRQATQFPSPLLGGDESSTSPNSFFDEQTCRDEDPTFQTIQNSHHRLNPQVLLIRSNFGESGGYGELTTTSSDCTSSNCSQVDPQGSSNSVGTDDGDCKWLGCNRSADDNTTATDLIDHIRQCHVQSQSDDSKSYVCLWVGCKSAPFNLHFQIGVIQVDVTAFRPQAKTEVFTSGPHISRRISPGTNICERLLTADKWLLCGMASEDGYVCSCSTFTSSAFSVFLLERRRRYSNHCCHFL
ncbi:UNVERIFIED_CONTAM: hypothetical protein NCL1_20912 [Trichonephila clavipes]